MATPQDPALTPAVATFVERLGSTLTSAGFPRLPARVFSALMVDEDGRMTAAELAAALQVSPASISGAVRYLSQIHLIHRERERGSRRDVFVLMEDAWHDVMMNTETSYAPIQNVMAEGLEVVGGPSTPVGERFWLSVEFFDFMSKELAHLAERWEVRRQELLAKG